MARPKRIDGLSQDKGQWLKAIGYARTKGGKVRARSWYLGSVSDDPNGVKAKETAAAIEAAWDADEQTQQIELEGKRVKVWSGSPSCLLKRPSVATSETGGTPEAPTSPSNPSAPTVRQAAQQYLEGIKRRWELGAVSRQYWTASVSNLRLPVAFLGAEKALDSVGFKEVEEAAMKLAARPEAVTMGKGLDEPVGLGRPISKVTAENYLKALRVFLDTLSKTEKAPGSNQPLWQKPLRFDKVFTKNVPQYTEDELVTMVASQNGDAPDTFTVEELTKLYKRANDRHKLWLLLGLNAGFANMELNTLRVSECQLANKPPRIARYRRKTVKRGNPKKSYAEWVLWDETTKLLQQQVADDKRTGNDTAIVNEDGLALVEARGSSRRDSVRSAWFNIVATLPEERRLSFKFIRKTGAQMIRAIAGDAVADMYLSHGDEKKMLGAYAGRIWDKLAEALQTLRQQLQPLFEQTAADKEIAEMEAFCQSHKHLSPDELKKAWETHQKKAKEKTAQAK